MKDPVSVFGRWRGFFNSGVAWKESRAIAKELVLPIVVLLARIRKLIPHHQNRHYDEIVRGPPPKR